MKEEFDALFPPGLHKIDLSDMGKLFVDPFPNSVARPIICEKFLSYIERIKSFGFPFTVWIDGSFCTVKPEPDDIDLMLVVNEEQINNIPPKKQQELGNLFNQSYAKSIYRCDVYLTGENDDIKLSYWRGWYGFYRDKVTAKGFAFLEITP